MIRAFFLILFVAGLAMAGAPWLSQTVLARDVGKYRLYDAKSGYLPAQVNLSGEALDVLVDMTTAGTTELKGGGALLMLTVAKDGQTKLAEALTFADSKPRDVNPQFGEMAFRASAGVLDATNVGLHSFTLGPGDAEGVDIRSVDLILKRHVAAMDARIQPVGFVLMAIGFIGAVLAFGRGGSAPPENPNSQPPVPRWGRGGSA